MDSELFWQRQIIDFGMICESSDYAKWMAPNLGFQDLTLIRRKTA